MLSLRSLLQTVLTFISASVVAGSSAFAQTPAPKSPPAPPARLSVDVTDENNVSVPGARVLLQPSASGIALRCQTEYSGRCHFFNLSPGSYELHVEKQGFYAAVEPVQVGQTFDVDVTLSHLREVREIVNVVESAPGIDPRQTSSQEQLSGVDVINIPYPVTRDYRNVLNYIPTVINDVSGQPHVTGAETYQMLAMLDGFNVSQPANGQLLIRVSTDAFRSINVQTSRYSAEYGKGSGGVIELLTGIGDDHFRFVTTDFIPSVQNKKGLELDKVTPRFTVSGPIRKGKVWFFDASDGEYDNIVVPELPSGQDHDTFWRVGNLAKIQSNVTSRNILTTSFDYNLSRDQYSGLSILSPPSASPAIRQSVYQTGVKDQHYFAGGELLEAGFGFNRYDLEEIPHGFQPYFVSPETSGGSYYFNGRTQADRWQALSNLYLVPKQWHGQHEFKLGIDLDRLTYNFNFFRQPISFLREGETSLQVLPPGTNCYTVTQLSQPSPCSRYSVFLNGQAPTQHNAELSGYLQDRWLVANRILIEAGLRYDWDEIVRDSLLSPRLATTYVLDSEANTKLAAGVGVVYDATPLFLIARPFAGERLDYFFGPNGEPPPHGPITTIFTANRNTLQAPRFLNWSVEIERKLPWQIYLKCEFIQKRGRHEFVYNSVTSTPLFASINNFVLQNTREDHYDSFQIGVRRTFQKGHAIMVSYTRSRSHSNQVLDFNVDNPIFSPQVPGPYPWDAPNRFLAWGFLPLIKGFDLAYSSEWRTGFPFYVVNNQQQLVEPPGSRQFPTYFVLNLHLEKRFAFLGYHWAVRGGFDNITDRRNPGIVNNDINSPKFLTYGGFTTRGFTTRLRFLGRK